MLEAAIRDRLRGDATVGDLVGAGDDARIYPVAGPQPPTFPCITYLRVSTVRDYHTTGPSGLVTARVQLDLWATDTESAPGFAAVRALADAVRARLDGWAGTQSDVVVQLARLLSERDLTDVDEVDTTWRVTQDWSITFEE